MRHTWLLHRLVPGFMLILLSAPAQAQGFFGTTTLLPFEISVNNERVLRLEPGTATDGPNVILGWSGNTVMTGVQGATIGGGGDPVASIPRPNEVSEDYGTVGGGLDNTASGVAATVGGGDNNTASGDGATVGGGENNTVNDGAATVGGGRANTASGTYATVGGGRANTASGDGATVGGGDNNTASGLYATVGGGEDNTANGSRATVAGGTTNTASSTYATVGGGAANKASGNRATVPGGVQNHARGDYSFAAGFVARAVHDGAFVWSDNSLTFADSLVSTAENQFLIRATGGVGIGTNAPQAALEVVHAEDGIDLVIGGTSNTPTRDDGVISSDPAYPGSDLFIHTNDALIIKLDADGSGEDADFFIRDKDDTNLFEVDEDGTVSVLGTVVHSSDRNRKERIETLDPQRILQSIAQLPLYRWSFKGDAVRHVGPMAQDFYAAFGIGRDETSIATVDADGVALAAIQALYQRVQVQDQIIEDLVRRLDALEER